MAEKIMPVKNYTGKCKSQCATFSYKTSVHPDDIRFACYHCGSTISKWEAVK